jgi:hypothetical protein
VAHEDGDGEHPFLFFYFILIYPIGYCQRLRLIGMPAESYISMRTINDEKSKTHAGSSADKMGV